MIFDLFLDKGDQNKKKKKGQQKASRKAPHINRSDDAFAQNSTNETSTEQRPRRVSKSPRARSRKYEAGMLSSGSSNKLKRQATPERKIKEKKQKTRRLDTSSMSNSTSSKRKKTDPHVLDLTFEEDDPELSLSSSDEESGQPREGCYQCLP